MKKKYLIIIPITILLTTIILLLTSKVYIVDNLFYKLVIHNDTLTFIMKFITNFGSYWYIFIISLILLLFYKNKKNLQKLYTITIFSSLLNEILKRIFKRPRPSYHHLVSIGGYSFPSGHAVVSLTFYGYLIYLVYKSNYSNKVKISIIIILVLLILLIGYSRVYLNVHFFSDVIAGFMISLILLSIYFTHSLPIK
jgi:undecaprenyl-diphosphatase